MTELNEKPTLSSRELEVLQAVAKGLSNQEIAQELVISINTVRVHLRNIFAKLEVQSRTEATMRAIQEGWVIPAGMTPPVPDAPANSNDEALPALPVVDAPPGLPQLAGWQRLYLAAALAVALLVLAVPVVKPLMERSGGNPITDQNPAQTVIETTSRSSHWRYLAQMPTARSRLAAAVYAGSLYLIGGDGAGGTTSLVEVYDSVTREWREGEAKPSPAANIQAVTLGNEIYVAGGCTNTSAMLDRLEIYNPATNTWRVGAPLPQPLCAYAAAAYSNTLYLIGGWNGSGYLDTVYRYTPAADVWELLEQPYPLKAGFAAAAVVGNQIYVAGGYDGEHEFATVYTFNPANKKWGEAPALKHPRGGLGLATVDGTLYAIGGGWTTLLSTNELLKPGASVWQELETPYIDQWRNFGVAVMGSEIMAAGGWTGEHLDSLETYQTKFKVFIPLSH